MRQLSFLLVCLLFISTFARPQEPESRQAHEGHGVHEHLVKITPKPKTGATTEHPSGVSNKVVVDPVEKTTNPDEGGTHAGYTPDPDPATTTTTGTPAPDFHDNGQDCWYVCGKRDGPCDHFCGTDGMCCRKEWPYYGCDGKEGGDFHICVLKRKPQILDLHRPFYTGGHPMSARSSHGNGQIPPHKASKIYDLVQEIKDVFHSNRRN